jgi:MscS family membrane protein
LHLGKTYALAVALAIFVFVGSTANSSAQLPTSAPSPPAKAEPATPIDPLGRETPRSAMMGLLKSGEREDYETAVRYLQPAPGQDTNLEELAKELHALHRTFKGSIGLLSDDPNGTVEPGLPPGQIRAGVLTVGGTTVDVILVRVDDPASGKIWLISKETVANIPKLYARWKAKRRQQPIESSPRAERSAAGGDVPGAMARVAAIDPDLVDAGLAVGVPP